MIEIKRGMRFKIDSGTYKVMVVGKHSSGCVNIKTGLPKNVNNEVIRMNLISEDEITESVYMKSLKVGDIVLVKHSHLGEIKVQVKKINPEIGLFYWGGVGQHSGVMGAIKGKNAIKKVKAVNESVDKLTQVVRHPEYGNVEVVITKNRETGKYRITSVGIEGDVMVSMSDLDSKDQRIIRDLVRTTVKDLDEKKNQISESVKYGILKVRDNHFGELSISFDINTSTGEKVVTGISVDDDAVITLDDLDAEDRERIEKLIKKNEDKIKTK